MPALPSRRPLQQIRQVLCDIHIKFMGLQRSFPSGLRNPHRKVVSFFSRQLRNIRSRVPLLDMLHHGFHHNRVPHSFPRIIRCLVSADVFHREQRLAGDRVDGWSNDFVETPLHSSGQHVLLLFELVFRSIYGGRETPTCVLYMFWGEPGRVVAVVNVVVESKVVARERRQQFLALI